MSSESRAALVVRVLKDAAARTSAWPRTWQAVVAVGRGDHDGVEGRRHRSWCSVMAASAADAQHFAAELVGRYEKDRQGWPAIALTTDTSALTAIGNDYGFERVFARQLAALGKKGDVAIGISTSGNSAERAARARDG
jgi:hypothetical protein